MELPERKGGMNHKLEEMAYAPSFQADDMVQFRAPYVPMVNGHKIDKVIKQGTPCRVIEVGIKNIVVKLNGYSLVIAAELVEIVTNHNLLDLAWEEVLSKSAEYDTEGNIMLSELRPIMERYIGAHP